MTDYHVLQRQKRLPGEGQRAQATSVSTRIPLLQPREVRSSRITRAPKSRGPAPLPPNGWRGERRPQENPHGGQPPTPPNGHAPLKEGWVNKGEAQGVRLPKKPRRRAEWSEAQREGQSLKGIFYNTHYRGTSSKTLPTAPQTNPYKCHKSHQQNTLYPYTSHMLGAGP